jgi:hypothetical protein
MLDDDGNVVGPVGVLVWAKWFEQGFFSGNDPRRVAVTRLDNETVVSTVFFGMNQQPDDDEPPILFETMVIPANSATEPYRVCYSNRADALTGHERCVAEVLRVTT